MTCENKTKTLATAM